MPPPPTSRSGALLLTPGPPDPGPFVAGGRAETAEPGADYIGYSNDSHGDAAMVL